MLVTFLFFISPAFAATTSTADQLQELEDKIQSAQAADHFEVDGDEMPEILDPEADRKPAVMDYDSSNGY